MKNLLNKILKNKQKSMFFTEHSLEVKRKMSKYATF